MIDTVPPRVSHGHVRLLPGSPRRARAAAAGRRATRRAVSGAFRRREKTAFAGIPRREALSVGTVEVQAPGTPRR